MTCLLHQLVENQATADPEKPALTFKNETLTYGELWRQVEAFAGALAGFQVGRGDRVAIYLEKRFESVVAIMGASAAGAVFVPLNPLLRPRQVGYILGDSESRLLVTSRDRLTELQSELKACRELLAVIVAGGEVVEPGIGRPKAVSWADLPENPTNTREASPIIDADMTSILYTSGSTGMPKGVMLSHRNMVAGAESVSQYLGNTADDVILSVLPLSFDAGFSQLSTAFNVGARVVLMNYLLPRDVVRLCAAEGVTGITGVPPLWIQLSQQDWPEEAAGKVRYFANTGGHMPKATLDRLRACFPRAKPYLMYGLTEAFRSTFLDPSEADRRPDSIGKAIPNAEILAIGPGGEACRPGETGELVHRGALVAMGYWKDPETTAQRFRPAPRQIPGASQPEIAVWSGDLVRIDEEGFFYFVGRGDDMIKTSGYRVSPTEVEDMIYSTGLVGEAVALGIPHPVLGQGILAVVTPPLDGALDAGALMQECRRHLPLYMVPERIEERAEIPRSPNGKMDRKRLAAEFKDAFQEDA